MRRSLVRVPEHGVILQEEGPVADVDDVAGGDSRIQNGVAVTVLAPPLHRARATAARVGARTLVRFRADRRNIWQVALDCCRW